MIPQCDMWHEADLAAAQGQHAHEINLRTRLLDADPLTAYNLTVSLRAAGYPVEPWLREVAARCLPWDPTLYYTLDMLALEVSDPAEADAIAAHADYLRSLQPPEASYGREENLSPDSPSQTSAAPAAETEAHAQGQAVVSPTNRGESVLSGSSKVTVGLIVAMGGGLYAIWHQSVESAKADAAWRARADEHYKHCEERLDGVADRLSVIESRMLAYEAWPGTQR